MHVNPAFRDDDQSASLILARKRGFGVVTVNGPEGPLAGHVPFVAEPTCIFLHFTRSNPMARLIRKQGPQQALLIVSGPDAYISPDWYGVDDQVPTWNYVAVHMRGQVELLPQDRLHAHLEALSEANETKLLPKKPWTMDKNRPETLEKLKRMIVPAAMTIETTEGTWKLNQNKDEIARSGAADALDGSNIGQNISELAELMRTWVRL
ncbi:MAG: FMN-binding negative transcriptional regulator [Pseudomonadota bacterium]